MVTCGLPGCAQKGRLRCTRCRITTYCSKEHQKGDWKAHKKVCATLAQGADPDCERTAFSTFRWAPGKRFMELPPPVGELPPLRGWSGYLEARGGAELVQAVQADPGMLDALSMPLSLLFAFHAMGVPRPSDDGGPLHALLLGTAAAAEQRVCLETDYWAELLLDAPAAGVRLHFVGPAIEPHAPVTRHGGRFVADFFKGTAGDFLDQWPVDQRPSGDRVRIVGYNPGFGNWVESQRYDLTWSWLPDLRRLADMGQPVVFTCANDYADLRGETAVITSVVGAPMRLSPRENPFSAASHHEDPSAGRECYCRANSFLYAFQGTVPDAGAAVASQAELLAALAQRSAEPMGYMLYTHQDPVPPPAAQDEQEDNALRAVVSELAEELALDIANDAAREVTAEVAAEVILCPSFDVREGASEIVVDVTVPGAESPADVDLDVAPLKLRVLVRDGPDSSCELPCAVNVDGVTAKWKRRTKLLRVTLPKR